MSPSYPQTVNTQPIGYAPILKHYMERCQIDTLIDRHVPLDPRRPELTHGEACLAMITGIFHQVFHLYALQKFATETDMLQVILPNVSPDAYFDDRFGDTLDALYAYGLGDLELVLTRHMMTEFKISTASCHTDTTTASVYGTYDSQADSDGISLTCGYSKKHRADLKQLVWALSVSSDSAFPLFQQAYDGNTADVSTYLEQWHHLIDVLGHREFLYVADSKLLSKDNMTYLHDHGGRFLAPVPMYSSYQAIFDEALANHPSETLLPYKDRLNRGFEVPCCVTHQETTYDFRMLLLYDTGLFARKSQHLTHRLEQTNAALQRVEAKLNRYRLKTHDAIDTACAAILRTYQTAEYVTVTITNSPQTTYTYAKAGRPAKTDEKVEVVTDHFQLTVSFHDEAIEDARYRCGYYALLTNVPPSDLSLAEAMLEHKDQYTSEHTNRRAKSQYCLEPVYLHLPKRIEAFLFLFKIVLQLLVLMERTVRNNLATRDQGLDGFRPNQQDVRNPTAEALLKEFQYIVKGVLQVSDGTTWPELFINFNHFKKQEILFLVVRGDVGTFESDLLNGRTFSRKIESVSGSNGEIPNTIRRKKGHFREKDTPLPGDEKGCWDVSA